MQGRSHKEPETARIADGLICSKLDLNGEAGEIRHGVCNLGRHVEGSFLSAIELSGAPWSMPTTGADSFAS
jgi:hypothetical protein